MQLFGVTCRFFDVGIRLFSDSAQYIDMFRKIYKPFIIAEAAAGEFPAWYLFETCPFSRGSSVIIDNTLYELPSGEAFLGHAEIFLFQKLIDRVTNYLLLHGGVVAQGDAGYIVYAGSGAGKTTLVLNLVLQGYKFLSDEYCPLRLEDFAVIPAPQGIGLKKDSPFLQTILRTGVEYVDCSGKYYVDCESIVPGSLGGVCKAKYFIMLTSEQEHQPSASAFQKIEVCLFREAESLIAILNDLPGVTVIHQSPKQFYTECILSLPRTRTAIRALHTFMKRYEHLLYYVAPVREKKTDFSHKPRLVPMQRSEALFEIFTNLSNRSPSSALLARTAQSYQQLLMTIATFLKDVECYRLTTGNLEGMTQLINAL